MQNDYFTLMNSDGTLIRNFTVLQSGFSPAYEKSQTIEKTLDGNLDISLGGIYRRDEYVIKVREQEDREDFGTIDDLRTFFSYNDPNGSPSNVITFITHREIAYNIIMTGNFQEQYLGFMLEGDQSWALVKCTFQFLSTVPIDIS
jgi:hypothetical protein